MHKDECFELVILLGRPKEGPHGKLPLLVDISYNGEAVFSEQAVESPLGHGLVVLLGVSWVVQRHLKLTYITVLALHLVVTMIPILPHLLDCRVSSVVAAICTHISSPLVLCSSMIS